MSLDALGEYWLGADVALEDVASGKAVLQRGAKGAAVRYVQERLGFTGSEVDGDFGTKTEQRVKEFKIAKGLDPDGVVGKNTLAAIDAMVMSGQKLSPMPATPPIVGPSAPSAKILAEKYEPFKAPPYGTYAAYGIGFLAVGGIIYAVLKR